MIDKIKSISDAVDTMEGWGVDGSSYSCLICGCKLKKESRALEIMDEDGELQFICEACGDAVAKKKG